MKTRILVAISNGYQVRLLFHSGVIGHLQAAGCEIAVVSSSPLPQEGIAELGEGIQVLQTWPPIPNRLVQHYQRARRFFLWPHELTLSQRVSQRRYARDFPNLAPFIELARKILPWSATLAVHRWFIRNAAARDHLLMAGRPLLAYTCDAA